MVNILFNRYTENPYHSYADDLTNNEVLLNLQRNIQAIVPNGILNSGKSIVGYFFGDIGKSVIDAIAKSPFFRKKFALMPSIERYKISDEDFYKIIKDIDLFSPEDNKYLHFLRDILAQPELNESSWLNLQNKYSNFSENEFDLVLGVALNIIHGGIISATDVMSALEDVEKNKDAIFSMTLDKIIDIYRILKSDSADAYSQLLSENIKFLFTTIQANRYASKA